MAVTLTTIELAEALAINLALADRLHAVAVALVERYAPLAPEGVQNVAVERCAGWLAEQPSASLRGHTLGPMSLDFAPSMISALRNSGAMALLSPWKERRGGVIG